jgi:hypothetical protein
MFSMKASTPPILIMLPPTRGAGILDRKKVDLLCQNQPIKDDTFSLNPKSVNCTAFRDCVTDQVSQGLESG